MRKTVLVALLAVPALVAAPAFAATAAPAHKAATTVTRHHVAQVKHHRVMGNQSIAAQNAGTRHLNQQELQTLGR